jgi:hypothetical protein
VTPFHRLGEVGGPFDPWAWFNIVGEVGCALWVVAYVLIIVRCFRDRSYGLPLCAICLNVSWELLASWVWPNPVPLWHAFDCAWFFVDLVIVYQLLRYGRGLQRVPEVRRHFYAIVAVSAAASVIGLHTFFLQYRDILGLVDAFIINLIINVTSIPFFLERRRQGGRGISVGAAWCKMLGTLCTAIECHYIIGMSEPWLPSLSFLTFLCASIFVTDVLYTYLVTKDARERARRAVLVAGSGFAGSVPRAA